MCRMCSVRCLLGRGAVPPRAPASSPPSAPLSCSPVTFLEPLRVALMAECQQIVAVAATVVVQEVDVTGVGVLTEVVAVAG